MVVIRLRRGGRTHDPHYRLVAQEKRSKLNGSYIENLGHYHPTDAQKKLEVNKERLEYWLSQGAELSPTVTNLLVKAGLLPAERRIVRLGVTKKPEAAPVEAKAEEAKAEEPKAEEAVTESEEAPAEKAAETVVEEVPAEETPAEETAEPETTKA